MLKHWLASGEAGGQEGYSSEEAVEAVTRAVISGGECIWTREGPGDLSKWIHYP